MALYWRRSTKILPGVRVNWSKTGPSLSVGPRGAKVNFGRRGTYVSGGIPGTGLYYRQKVGGNKTKRKQVGTNTSFPVNNVSNSSTNSISGKALLFLAIILIVILLIVTQNYITCGIFIVLVGIIWLIVFAIQKSSRTQNCNIPTSPSNNTSNSANCSVPNMTSDDESAQNDIDIKVALSEIEYLITQIDNCNNKATLPSYYRKLMSTISKIGGRNDISIKGIPLDVAKVRIIENYRRKMNS